MVGGEGGGGSGGSGGGGGAQNELVVDEDEEGGGEMGRTNSILVFTSALLSHNTTCYLRKLDSKK